MEKKRNWSKEEAALLEKTISEHALLVARSPAVFTQDDWLAVAAKIPTRSFVQCKTRWAAANLPKKHKAFWNSEEDKILKELVAEHGEKSWAIIAQKITAMKIGEERIGKQCRERYYNHVALNSQDAKDNKDWSDKEDSILHELIAKLGTSWKKIAQSLPGRSETAVKNR